MKYKAVCVLFHRKKPGDHLFWTGVDPSHITAFFSDYLTSRTATRAISKYMAQYIQDMNQVGGLLNWTVCLINMERENLPSICIGNHIIGAGIYRQEGHGVTSQGDTVSINTMMSEGHEYYDYTQEQLDKKELLSKHYLNNGTGGKYLRELLRKETRPYERGLLLLYPIADAGALTAKKGEHRTPFGFAVVFPDRKGKGNLKRF